MQAIKTSTPIIANVVAIVFAMASVLVFAWRFDYVPELYAKILLTLIAVIILVAFLFDETRKVFQIDKFRHAFLWMLLPVTLLVLALISTHLERWLSLVPPALALNIGFLCASAFPAFICYRIAGRQRFLVTTSALNIGMGWLWLDLEILKSAGVEFLMGPLLVVMWMGIPWVLVLRLSWECAKRKRARPLMGPAMESLTMFLVAVPLVTLAILSVMAVTDGQHWVALAGIIVSFLFSSAVATPFRKFLRVLARFDESGEPDRP